MTTVRVALLAEENGWAEIGLAEALAAVEVEGEGEGRAAVRRLAKAISAWSLPNPVSEESVGDLDESDGMFLDTLVVRGYAPLERQAQQAVREALARLQTVTAFVASEVRARAIEQGFRDRMVAGLAVHMEPEQELFVRRVTDLLLENESSPGIGTES